MNRKMKKYRYIISKNKKVQLYHICGCGGCRCIRNFIRLHIRQGEQCVICRTGAFDFGSGKCRKLGGRYKRLGK
ncbi:unknown [[Eubacterium] siraeum CAG:80]|uniref:Uncharacterized protein n=1 Tax=[Eubacterium] siraeum CAG:80 TaxID=1263080 RepID=R6RF73_9FIRM|nr:unknown [[Eubacterium] siraeum CAG:80]